MLISPTIEGIIKIGLRKLVAIFSPKKRGPSSLFKYFNLKKCVNQEDEPSVVHLIPFKSVTQRKKPCKCDTASLKDRE